MDTIIKIDKTEISIPQELSSLGGALYIAVLKNVIEDSWDNKFEQYLNDFKQTLLELDGEIDKTSCLTELSAAQISAPAIEGNFDKTNTTIDKAAAVLELDTKELETPKYISLGRRFVNWVNRRPKCLIAAAIAAGILFAGSGNTLIGPGPAYADDINQITKKVSSAIKNGFDADYSSKRGFEFEYDGDKVTRRLGNIGADVVEDLVSDGINGVLNGIFGGISGGSSSSKSAVKSTTIVSHAIYADELDLDQEQRKIALTGAYILKHIPNGLTAQELSLAVTMLAPKLENVDLANVTKAIAMMSTYDKESQCFTISKKLDSQLAEQMRKANRKFSETETLITFATTAGKVAQNIISNGGQLDETLSGLLAKAKSSIQAVYDNPVMDKIQNASIDQVRSVAANILEAER